MNYKRKWIIKENGLEETRILFYKENPSSNTLPTLYKLNYKRKWKIEKWEKCTIKASTVADVISDIRIILYITCI